MLLHEEQCWDMMQARLLCLFGEVVFRSPVESCHKTWSAAVGLHSWM